MPSETGGTRGKGVGMSLPLEDYGLIGDTHTAALVGAHGSVDWLCLPRFDSGACFAALLGTDDNGLWSVGPADGQFESTRRYRGPTLVLETEFRTGHGEARVVDCMPPRRDHPRLVRMVEGIRGEVSMRTRFKPRFDYGKTVPWVTRNGNVLSATAGPDALELRSDVPLEGHDFEHSAEFTVSAGQRVGFVLSWHQSWEEPPQAIDAATELMDTEEWWKDWAARSTYSGGWPEDVERSLLTLKGLTFEPTGGIVAAPTTSLPEFLGGVRNWDYRYCWLRDASLTLDALMDAGYLTEAQRWRDWLLRAVAGDPQDLQIMYGLGGERWLNEYELDWLPGYESSAPVRVGNAASRQLQLDVYGEAIDVLYRARRLGVPQAPHASAVQRQILDWLESHWREPDQGIWEVRGPRRDFVHSKVMAWVAADRIVRSIEELGFEGPLNRYRQLRSDIQEEVCREGFDAERNTFTQYYGSRQLDAALLLIPQVGFLPPTDSRVIGTVEAVERELLRDGFVMRYLPDEDSVDGLPPGEGAFLACSFWLVDDLAMIGRRAEAEELFDRLLSLRNDLGLFSEQYDPVHQRLVGNFPQAFTHLAMISSAKRLSGEGLGSRTGGPPTRITPSA
jgi:GH15 family glucan-1,4-alpha-glucosidase